MHRGRSGRAGVFDPGRALEAQIGSGLEHQRGGEILGREAAVEMAQHDFVDVLGLDPGVGERLLGDAHDQALDGFAFELAERGVGPSNDAGGHDGLLGFAEIWSLSWAMCDKCAGGSRRLRSIRVSAYIAMSIANVIALPAMRR